MKTENKSNKGNNKPSNQPVDSRIEAVRDLIFGENMQQYDQDFTEVSSQIAELRKDTDKSLANLASNLQNKIDAFEKSTEASLEKMATDIDKKLERLDDAKADRKKLGKALEKIALMLQG